ncbi:MAG: alpha/beta hydrolase [Muribaculaceae bacterium]|nr:alpha/beta hydrolase [Muribaculaceae bacterium]
MEKTIELNGIKINYTVCGEGSPVVLMHGWGCNLTTLASIENYLLPSFKVINIDFPGFGKSEEPKEIWSVEDYTLMTEQLLAAENVKSPIMLGHSFGGRVGIIYASRNEVKKLILVDAAGVKPRRTFNYYRKVYSYKMIKHFLLLVFGKEKGEKMLDRYRGKVGSSDYNSSTSKMRAIMSKVVNQDLKSLMPKIKCPTLLIWGEEDKATPLSDAKIMEQLIPNAGLVSFPGVGHYSFLDNPYQFKAVILSFLEEDLQNK